MAKLRFESLDLHVNDRCNLRCKYCYIFSKDHHRLPDISDELVAKLPAVAKKLGVKVVNFFGGEPMLSFEKIRKIVELLEPLGVRFTIVTNGTTCTPEQAAFIQKHRIGTQRSIDGCPEACAYNRPNVTEKYLRLTDFFKDRNRPRRSTFTPENVHLLHKSWLWLKENGFAAGWTPIPDLYAKWNEAHIIVFQQELFKIARDFIQHMRKTKKPFYFYWFDRVAPALRDNGSGQSRKGCGAGATLVALRQDGYFFACHRFVTEKPDSDWCLGHVDELLADSTTFGLKGQAKEAIEKCRLRFAQAKEFEQCKHCPVKAGCSGGCYHTNLAATGNAAMPQEEYCKFRRAVLPVVQFIDRELKGEFPDWWRRNASNKKQSDCCGKVASDSRRGSERRPDQIVSSNVGR